MYVTDTHSFIWHLKDDEKLGEKAKEIFEMCDNGQEIIVVPSIVLIESMFLCEKKKVDLEFKEILKKLKISSNYQTYPLDDDIIFECTGLILPDPHDRIIVATARLLKAKVITKDEDIENSGLVETIW